MLWHNRGETILRLGVRLDDMIGSVREQVHDALHVVGEVGLSHRMLLQNRWGSVLLSRLHIPHGEWAVVGAILFGRLYMEGAAWFAPKPTGAWNSLNHWADFLVGARPRGVWWHLRHLRPNRCACTVRILPYKHPLTRQQRALRDAERRIRGELGPTIAERTKGTHWQRMVR